MRWRRVALFSCSLGAIFAFSSAPIQTMFLGFGLLIYNSVLSQISFRWSALFAIGAAGVIAAFLISNSPVGFIISHLTFSPESGYYREWTWHMVGLYVSQSPWFGLGYGEMPEEINHSIDSLWLVLALQSGYPGPVFVALSLVGASAILTSDRNAGLTPAEAKLATTLGIVLFLTAFIAFTVHLWGSSWILTGLLIGTKAHLSELGYLRPSATRQHLS
jgi:O-antigen ligase